MKEQHSATEGADEELSSNAKFYKWLSIGIWIVLTLVLIITVCLFDRIKLAVNVIKAAAEFVGEEKGIILVPIVLFLVKASYVTVHLYGTAAIFSTGEIYHNPDYPWGKIRYSESLK
jgi:choline transporter-like protein 2/4/5